MSNITSTDDTGSVAVVTEIAKNDSVDDHCLGSNCGGSHGNDDNGNNNSNLDGPWIDVCDYTNVKDSGQMFGFCNDTHRILVANHNGTIHATDLICTHADADLSTGFMGPDGVRCPLHLSVFNLKDGNPQNPPAEKPLRVYNVKIDAGHVYVRV